MRPMKVLFLSSDTGGGHRASAEALAVQLLRQFPGSTYDVMDVWFEEDIWPYSKLTQTYQHLSAHPAQWRFIYHLTNTTAAWRPWGHLYTMYGNAIGRRKILDRLAQYDPDVIVSVHPTMQHTPLLCCRELGQRKGYYIPFFTVVTDLASAHVRWFDGNVDKVYVASESLCQLAMEKGHVPRDKVVMSGLPIRNDFAIQASQLGDDRYSESGQAYQQQVKTELGLHPISPMILLMGGGEGVGGLSSIANALFVALTRDGISATVCVVCGRNETLRAELQTRDWEKLLLRKRTITPSSSFRQEVEDEVDERGGRRRPSEDPASPSTKTPPPTPTRTSSSSSPDEDSSTLHSTAKALVDTSKNQLSSKDEDGGNSSSNGDNQIVGASDEDEEHDQLERGNGGVVTVVGLGFVDRMAEYMVAAHILVTKAGPGTIAEAAALGLPVLLTSYLPGQEAGNVEFVLDRGFGVYVHNPADLGPTVVQWLRRRAKQKSLHQQQEHHQPEQLSTTGSPCASSLEQQQPQQQERPVEPSLPPSNHDEKEDENGKEHDDDENDHGNGEDSPWLALLSSKAKATGRPNAAAEIALDIGTTTQQWLRKNRDDTIDMINAATCTTTTTTN